MQELSGKRRVSNVQWKREATLAFRLPLRLYQVQREDEPFTVRFLRCVWKFL